MRQIGICRGKRGLEQHCHSEPVRTLVWESPSNSRQLIVIQTVVFVPFSGILPREVVRLTGGLPHQSEDWFAMTGNSIARQIPICRAADFPVIASPTSQSLRASSQTGVAISWLDKKYNFSWMNSGKRYKKAVCMTIDSPEFDGDSHTSLRTGSE